MQIKYQIILFLLTYAILANAGFLFVSREDLSSLFTYAYIALVPPVLLTVFSIIVHAAIYTHLKYVSRIIHLGMAVAYRAFCINILTMIIIQRFQELYLYKLFVPGQVSEPVIGIVIISVSSFIVYLCFRIGYVKRVLNGEAHIMKTLSFSLVVYSLPFLTFYVFLAWLIASGNTMGFAFTVVPILEHFNMLK